VLTPSSATVFEYCGLSIDDFESILGQAPLLIGAKGSSQWLWERAGDDPLNSTKLSYAARVLIPDTMGQDMAFVISVGWSEGWRLVNSVRFHSVQTHPVQY
jgi:hypothetical protein